MASELTGAQTADLKSLELLFDYTKFHIGFYFDTCIGLCRRSKRKDLVKNLPYHLGANGCGLP